MIVFTFLICFQFCELFRLTVHDFDLKSPIFFLILQNYFFFFFLLEVPVTPHGSVLGQHLLMKSN